MKKQIFACISVILCFLLCACEETKPAETTTAKVATAVTPVETTTVSVETTAVTTTFALVETTTSVTTAMPIETTTATAAPTETTIAATSATPILSTEPQTVTVHTSVQPRLDWITSLANGYRHNYVSPAATFTYTLPAGWISDDSTISSNDYVTLDKKQHIVIYCLNEIGTESALPSFSYQSKDTERVQTIESHDLRVEIYEYSAPQTVGYTFSMQGFVRIQDKYMLRFMYDTDKNNTDELCDILQTVALVEVQEQAFANAAEVQINEELRTVRIDNLIAIIEEEFQIGVITEELSEEMHIEINLPASWELLPTKNGEMDVSEVFYTEFGMPGSGTSPKKCLYQAFHSVYLYIEDTTSRIGTEGITASGNKYWLLENVIDDYHAIEYKVYVQLSDTYFWYFKLCADKDNTELIYQVIDSIRLY